ncbi:hypothetical protein Kisp02_71680 [Kineosporia sp. NBRC 101731]|nr:hypothetical protein Kisp02_71680 [Kineosporia sp. NBRC 101731]
MAAQRALTRVAGMPRRAVGRSMGTVERAKSAGLDQANPVRTGDAKPRDLSPSEGEVARLPKD